MRALTFRAWNFRGLEHVEFSPTGVSLLAGRNAAGKTTMLKGLRLMADMVRWGLPFAVKNAGGTVAFKSIHARSDEDVVLELSRGPITWRLGIPVEGDAVLFNGYAETVTINGVVALDVPRLKPTFTLQEPFIVGPVGPRTRSGRSELETLKIVKMVDEDINDFVKFTENIRVYQKLEWSQAISEKDDSGDAYLHASCANLVPLLRDWRLSPRTGLRRYQWVLSRLQLAFPGVCEDIEITPDGRAWILDPNAADPESRIPLQLAASGFITGLLQLVALAGAAPGSLICFDEVENQLHPHAIRVLIQAMRDISEERDLTIILTTHSPVVMNEFKDREDHFFVIEADTPPPVPKCIEELHDPNWLAHFSLGDLYEREAFSAPKKG